MLWNQCVVLDNSRTSYAKGSRSRRLCITPHITTLFVIILHYITVVYCVTTGMILGDVGEGTDASFDCARSRAYCKIHGSNYYRCAFEMRERERKREKEGETSLTSF